MIPWEKDPKIIRKKGKSSLILLEVNLYEVCASLFQMIYYCYYFYTNTSFSFVIFVASLTLGEWSLGITGEEYLSWKETRRKMGGGG